MKTAKEKILNLIIEKSIIKQQIYDNTFNAFETLKTVLQEICTEYNVNLPEGTDPRVSLEFHERSPFALELKVAGDIVLFIMHTNIFDVDPDHSIRKSSYIKENPLNSYCGVIWIYNFLADSFKYSRWDDLGYLIGRIMINRDNHYFVEGKRQLGFLYNDIAQDIVTFDALRNVADSAILYSIDFDLQMIPLKNMPLINVAQVEEGIKNAGTQTGKRLGFKFYRDDE